MTGRRLIGSRFKLYFTDPERVEAAIKQVVQQVRITNCEYEQKELERQLRVSEARNVG
jgi:ATP-dependent exoDNAse (exonuclease V) alpha subunit